MFMNKRPGRERVLSTRRIYEGHILNLRVDEVEMESGCKAEREVVEHHMAVGILPVTEKNGILLARQFRYAVNEETLEICAGLVEKGESLEEAAKREMQEELGYLPAFLFEIGRFYASPGFCTELLVLFLATDLSGSNLPQDDDEDVQVVEVPWEKIPMLLAEGAVRDAKTFAALSWFMAWKGMKPQAIF
jgi:ADP-ribose pyrophosphatase